MADSKAYDEIQMLNLFTEVRKFHDNMRFGKVQLEKRIKALEKENAELRTELRESVKRLAKENAELRAATGLPAAPAEAPEPVLSVSEVQDDKVGARLRANGFAARVIASSNEERALTNCAYYNPGRPFTGDLYVLPDPDSECSRTANACLRVIYSSDTPKMCIEVGLFNRLYHQLPLDSEQFTEFKPVPAPLPAASCKLVITTIRAPAVAEDAPTIKPYLEGHLMMDGCMFAVKTGGGVYKCKALSVNPNGAGVFTKDTLFTMVGVDGVHEIC